jgi:hypothetical protein
MGAYESPTVYKLTVNSTGMGGGVINSAPAWISCGNVCEVILADGALITLIAEADIDSQFDGWGGACISAGTGACALTMDSAKSVTANFSLTQHKLSVSLTGDGDGKVTSQPAGIDCGGDCSQDFDYNQQVSLTAAADPGSTFTGWGGACSGSGTCEVSMTAAKTVNAEFTAAGFEVYLPVEFK